MDSNAAVINAGSSAIRAGLSGVFPTDVEPRVEIPPAVLGPVNSGDVQIAFQHSFDGFAVPDNANQETTLAIDNGRICNWEAYEALCDYILYGQLGWTRGAEGCVLITEPLFGSKSERERITELMFETFNVNGLFMEAEPVLSLYAVGKLTGSTIDIGHSKIDIGTVQEGQLLSSCSCRVPYGCREAASHLGRLLHDSGAVNSIASQAAVCRPLLSSLLAAAAEVAESPEQFNKRMAQQDNIPEPVPMEDDGEDGADADAAKQGPRSQCLYTLPDGQKVYVKMEGLQTGEALVTGALGRGHDLGAPLAELLAVCQQWQHDALMRKGWMEAVVVCGGGSGLPGVAQRLLRDLRLLVPESCSPALAPCPDYMPDRTLALAAWMGGAVLSRVVFSQEKNPQAVVKAEYDEVGPVAVHRKCG